MITKYIFGIAAVASGFATVCAQDMSTEITVDRTIVPRKQEASPLPSVVPSLLPSEGFRSKLGLTEYSAPVSFMPLASPSMAPSYTGIAGAYPYKGYAWLGYFPAYNLGVGAGYSIISNSSTHLGVAAQFNGFSYHSTSVAGDKGTAKNNTIGMQADFSHTFSKAAALSASVAYTHGSMGLPELMSIPESQKLNDFKATLGLDGRFGSSARYAIEAYASNFSLTDGCVWSKPETSVAAPSEGLYGVGASLEAGKGVAVFKLGLGADFHHRSGSEWRDDSFDAVAHENSAIFSIDPSVGARVDALTVRLGADIDISTGTDDKKFNVAPSLLVSWVPSASFSAYATVDGGKAFSTLSRIRDYSPFALSVVSYDAVFTPVAGRAGFVVGPFHGASVELYGRYACTRNAPMMALAAAYNTPAFLPVGISGWGAGARLAWNHSIVSFEASAQILANGYSSAFIDVPDRAGLLVGASLELRPFDKFTAGLGWELRARRRYYSLAQGQATEVGMGNISDLKFDARYEISGNFDVWARVENLLCRRAELLPGLQTQGVHGLVGVMLRF